MVPVVHPLTGGRHPFARTDRGGMPDHRHQIAMTPRLYSRDTKAVLGVVERDALDQAGENLVSCGAIAPGWCAGVLIHPVMSYLARPEVKGMAIGTLPNLFLLTHKSQPI